MACRCSPAGAGVCACVVNVADTDTVDMTAAGTGTPEAPRTISSVVKVSGAAGNTVTVNADGLYVAPSPPVPPVAGCGIDVVGNTVSVDTSAEFTELTRETCGDLVDASVLVALPPACELQGMPIYCDSNGELRTKPEKFTDTEVRSMNEAFLPPITAYPFTASPIAQPITNPSSCYCMCGFLQFAALPDITAAPGTVYHVFYEFDHDGNGTFDQLGTTTVDNRGKTAPSRWNQRIPLVLNVCLDPGETKAIQFRVRIERNATLDNGGAITMSGMSREIRWFGVNL
jgi:hypothetical protein